MATDHEMRMEALRLFEENEKLRTALRRLAIAPRPNATFCTLCDTRWLRGQPESHLASCLLARRG